MRITLRNIGKNFDVYTPHKIIKLQPIFSPISTLLFDDEKESWDKFRSNFMNIVDEVGSYDQEISNEQKKKKLLRTLPEAFKPIVMVFNINEMSFNDVVNTINAQKEGQNNVHNPSSSSAAHSINNTFPQAYISNAVPKNRGRGEGRVSFRGRGKLREEMEEGIFMEVFNHPTETHSTTMESRNTSLRAVELGFKKEVYVLRSVTEAETKFILNQTHNDSF